MHKRFQAGARVQITLKPIQLLEKVGSDQLANRQAGIGVVDGHFPGTNQPLFTVQVNGKPAVYHADELSMVH